MLEEKDHLLDGLGETEMPAFTQGVFCEVGDESCSLQAAPSREQLIERQEKIAKLQAERTIPGYY